MKKVGIIGGLGPETTSKIYLDLIFSCQNRNKMHRPSIIISSVPLPYLIEKEAISKNIGIDRCLPFIINEAKILEKSGADFIVMPCNSLHIFIKEIRNSVKIPVLSIVEETVKFLKKNKFKKVGVVSTFATVKNKLYETAFEKNNIVYEIPDKYKQAKIGKIVLNLVRGIKNDKDRNELFEIISQFKKKDVDCVILACTDLQLLLQKTPKLKIFDTMKIFEDAIVKRILE